jgi:hypothetical protein
MYERDRLKGIRERQQQSESKDTFDAFRGHSRGYHNPFKRVSTPNSAHNERRFLYFKSYNV